MTVQEAVASSTVDARPIRVLHLAPFASRDGAYGGPLTVAVDQVRELRRLGVDVDLAAGWLGDDDPPLRLFDQPAYLFPVRRAVPGPRFAGLVSPALQRWLRRCARGYDLVHVHFTRDLLSLAAAAELRRQGIPYVTQTHGTIRADPRLQHRVVDRLVTLRLLRAAARRFALTDVEAASLQELTPDLPYPSILRNGVRISGVTARTGEQIEDPQERAPEVLFLARLHPMKQVLVFAEVALRLLSEGVQAQFTVVGPDGGDLSALLALINKHELQGKLNYEGAAAPEQAIERIAAADVYVLPANRDPYPMSVLEALSVGVPTVCSTACGMAPLLRRHRAGIVVEPTPDEVARALRQLLADPSERAALGARGLATARDVFSLTAIAEQLRQNYRIVAAGQST